MSGILRLESLKKGDTLKQGDKTPLKYRLFDAGGRKLSVAGKPAKVRLAHRDFLTIGYEKDGLTVAQDDTVTFTIDSIIPPRIYYVEIIVDDKFIFPSRPDESKFTVNKSSLGAETDIIQIIGKDEIVRDVKARVENDLEPFLGEISEISEEAITKANQADNLSKSVQSQFNQVVIDGDSSVEAAQARVDTSGNTNATLKERLDKEHNEVTSQLAHNSLLLESQRSVKEFLCDDGQYVQGDGVHDDTTGIQRALNESNNLFFPEGLYKTTETLTVFSPENKSTDIGSLRFMGKKIDFNAGARIMVHTNVDGMIVKGNSNHFVNLTIDVSKVGSSYTKSALVLSSDDYSISCNANVFDAPKILQGNPTKKGTAIELRTENLGYIYRNKFINLEIWQFEHGIRFNRNSSMGINSNSFQGAIWASKQLIYCAGGGNTFDILGQATTVDDDTACVYVTGNYNTFDGFIYDVGNPGLNQYAYEFDKGANKNTVTSWYHPNTIKNDYNMRNFILLENKDVQLVLPSGPPNETEFNDYGVSQGHEIPKSMFKMISGLNNSLGRDIVDTITATATNLTFSGIKPNETPDDVRKLFDHNIFSKSHTDVMRFRQTLPDMPSSLEMTFNLKDNTNNFTSIEDIGVIVKGAVGTGDNTAYTVTGMTEKGDIINYSRFGGEPVNPQIDKQVLFEDKTGTVYYNNRLVSFTIRLDFKPNVLPSTGGYGGLVYIYANMVDDFGSNSSFPYIGGDTYTGDIEFHDRDLAGIVLKSPTGGRYRLMVDGTGTLSTIKL